MNPCQIKKMFIKEKLMHPCNLDMLTIDLEKTHVENVQLKTRRTRRDRMKERKASAHPESPSKTNVTIAEGWATWVKTVVVVVSRKEIVTTCRQDTTRTRAEVRRRSSWELATIVANLDRSWLIASS